jgi:hypothetical protein
MVLDIHRKVNDLVKVEEEIDLKEEVETTSAG